MSAMKHGVFAGIVDRNAGGVRAAPEACLLLVALTFVASYFAIQRSHGERFTALNDKIASQEALLTEYRTKLQAAPQQEATVPLERLTNMLTDIQRSLNETRSPAALPDKLPRDPRHLYDGDNAVALVRDPVVDLDQKRITFPAVTSEVLLGINKSYEFQSWKLACGGTQLYNTIGNGATREFSYSPLTCKIIGSR